MNDVSVDVTHSRSRLRRRQSGFASRNAAREALSGMDARAATGVRLRRSHHDCTRARQAPPSHDYARPRLTAVRGRVSTSATLYDAFRSRGATAARYSARHDESYRTLPWHGG